MSSGAQYENLLDSYKNRISNIKASELADSARKIAESEDPKEAARQMVAEITTPLSLDFLKEGIMHRMGVASAQTGGLGQSKTGKLSLKKELNGIFDRKMKQLVDKARGKARDVAADAQNKLKDTVDQARGKAEETIQAGKDQVTNTVGAARDAVNATANEAKANASAALDGAQALGGLRATDQPTGSKADTAPQPSEQPVIDDSVDQGLTDRMAATIEPRAEDARTNQPAYSQNQIDELTKGGRFRDIYNRQSFKLNELGDELAPKFDQRIFASTGLDKNGIPSKDDIRALAPGSQERVQAQRDLMTYRNKAINETVARVRQGLPEPVSFDKDGKANETEPSHWNKPDESQAKPAVTEPTVNAASATDQSQNASSVQKSFTDHVDSRVTQIRSKLDADPNLKVKIAGGNGKTTIGTGEAVQQHVDYAEATGQPNVGPSVQQHINDSLDNLQKDYPDRVSFGNVGGQIPADELHVWGANKGNIGLPSGTKIEGAGQAASIGTASDREFGIVSTPLAGVPSETTAAPSVSATVQPPPQTEPTSIADRIQAGGLDQLRTSDVPGRSGDAAVSGLRLPSADQIKTTIHQAGARDPESGQVKKSLVGSAFDEDPEAGLSFRGVGGRVAEGLAGAGAAVGAGVTFLNPQLSTGQKAVSLTEQAAPLAAEKAIGDVVPGAGLGVGAIETLAGKGTLAQKGESLGIQGGTGVLQKAGGKLGNFIQGKFGSTTAKVADTAEETVASTAEKAAGSVATDVAETTGVETAEVGAAAAGAETGGLGFVVSGLIGLGATLATIFAPHHHDTPTAAPVNLAAPVESLGLR